MRIGVPKEIKVREYRVGLIPANVRELVAHGHHVAIETGAGAGIGMTDEHYAAAGAEILPDAAEVFAKSDMIVKVKEPLANERKMLRKDQILFTYLHLAPDPEQTNDLIESGATCIAYETVTSPTGGLPLLAPMSEVAGRMSIQAGAYHLEKAHGGLGVLLGGVPGVDPGKVVVIGGGVVGTHAIHIALGMGADVWVLDRNVDVLRRLWQQFDRPLNTVFSTRDAVERHCMEADLVIGAVLVPGRCSAEDRLGRTDQAHETGFGGGRRRHRPRRLFRDLEADDARRTDLCGRRRRSLLCGQHARWRPTHIGAGAQQCDVAVRSRDCGQGLAAGAGG